MAYAGNAVHPVARPGRAVRAPRCHERRHHRHVPVQRHPRRAHAARHDRAGRDRDRLAAAERAVDADPARRLGRQHRRRVDQRPPADASRAARWSTSTRQPTAAGSPLPPSTRAPGTPSWPGRRSSTWSRTRASPATPTCSRTPPTCAPRSTGTSRRRPPTTGSDRLREHGVWCGPVNHLEDVIDDEQIAANGYLTTLDDGLRTVAMPFTLSGFEQPVAGGPVLDGDRESILSDWGVRGP